MRRTLGLSLFILLTGVIFYSSRYWIFRLWPRDGLLGVEPLRPQGNLLQPALRGTDFAPFDLLIFAVAVFLSLSILQSIWSRIFK